MKEKIIVPIFNSVDFNRVTEEILDEFYDARLIIGKSDMQVLIPASIYDGESVSDSHFYLITKQNSITNYINIPGLGITFIIINMNIFEPTYYSFDKNLIEYSGFGEDDCIVKLRLFSSDNELIFSPDEWYEKFNRILITSHYYSEEELNLLFAKLDIFSSFFDLTG